MMLRRVQAMVQALTGGIDSVGGWMKSGELHHKAAHMYEAMEQGYEMGAPLATLAGHGLRQDGHRCRIQGREFLPRQARLVLGLQRPRERGRPLQRGPAGDDGLPGCESRWRASCNTRASPTGPAPFIINAANPVRHYYPDTYWKEVLSHENMELVVLVDVLPSDTAPYADVILPNTTYLERDEPTLYGNGVNQDLALTTRYAAIDPLYDTEETADILLKLTEIISGNTEGFLMWVEQLTGLKAEPVKAAHAETKKTHEKGSFAAACRRVSFAQTAERLGVTPEHIDQVLREKGVYHEEDKQEILAHQAMPRKMPVPTDSGRVEFFSALMRSLRDGGSHGAQLPRAGDLDRPRVSRRQDRGRALGGGRVLLHLRQDADRLPRLHQQQQPGAVGHQPSSRTTSTRASGSIRTGPRSWASTTAIRSV